MSSLSPVNIPSPHPIRFVTRSTSKKPPFTKLSIDGREVKVYGITRNKILRDLTSALEGIAEPVLSNERIASLKEVVQKIPRLPMRQVELGVDPFVTPEELADAKKRLELKKVIQEPSPEYKHVLSNLVGKVTALWALKFIAGKKFWGKILQKVPVEWRVSKESVIELKKRIRFQLEALEKGFAEERVVVVVTDRKRAHELLSFFKEEKEYILPDSWVPKLLPFRKYTLNPIPRVETMKKRLRDYFSIENLLWKVTPEMERLATQVKESLVEELDRTEDVLEKLVIYQKAGFERPLFTQSELKIFFQFLSIAIPESNALLMDPFDLGELEQFRRGMLDNFCIDMGLKVSFRQQGREVEVGALPGLPLIEERDEVTEVVRIRDPLAL